MRARSPKMQRLYVLRRQIVADLLEQHPWCEVQWDDDCDGRAVDVDERMGRGVGGSILDEANLQTVCRPCHAQKHSNPAEAVRRGVTVQRRSPDAEGAA